MITYKLGALCLQRACSKSVCVLVVLGYKALIHDTRHRLCGSLVPQNFGPMAWGRIELRQEFWTILVLNFERFWLLGLGKYSEFRFQSFSVSESFLRFGKVVEASGRFQVQFQRFGKGCGELR